MTWLKVILLNMMVSLRYLPYIVLLTRQDKMATKLTLNKGQGHTGYHGAVRCKI